MMVHARSTRLSRQPPLLPLLLPPLTAIAVAAVEAEAEAEEDEDAPLVGAVGDEGSIDDHGLEAVAAAAAEWCLCGLYTPCPWRPGRPLCGGVMLLGAAGAFCYLLLYYTVLCCTVVLCASIFIFWIFLFVWFLNITTSNLVTFVLFYVRSFCSAFISFLSCRQRAPVGLCVRERGC